MKKLLLAFILAAFGVANVNAQDEQDIQFGIKGGLNFSSLYGEAEYFETVTSFNFGFIAEIPIKENFSFQPELLYSGQGSSGGGNTLDLSYLNLPLIGKYYVAKGFSLEAGPQIGYLSSAKLNGSSVTNNYKRMEVGVNVGIGYKLDNGINFGVRYNFGLTNINDFYGRNGVLQFSVGYFF